MGKPKSKQKLEEEKKLKKAFFQLYVNLFHKLSVLFLILCMAGKLFIQCLTFLATQYHGHLLSVNGYEFCPHFGQLVCLILSPFHIASAFENTIIRGDFENANIYVFKESTFLIFSMALGLLKGSSPQC